MVRGGDAEACSPDGVRRGSVVSVEGVPGAGATSVALELVSAVTAAGEWAAWMGERTLGAEAAAEAGVALERFVVVRGVPPEHRARAVGALVEGLGVVVLDRGSAVRAAEARRLTARVRERRGLLVALGGWPEGAAVRLRAGGGPWRIEAGRLVPRAVEVEAVHRGRTRLLTTEDRARLLAAG